MAMYNCVLMDKSTKRRGFNFRVVAFLFIITTHKNMEFKWCSAVSSFKSIVGTLQLHRLKKHIQSKIWVANYKTVLLVHTLQSKNSGTPRDLMPFKDCLDFRIC
jgi:hypothetical protein